MQVCSDIGRAARLPDWSDAEVNWIQMRKWLWSQALQHFDTEPASPASKVCTARSRTEGALRVELSSPSQLCAGDAVAVTHALMTMFSVRAGFNDLSPRTCQRSEGSKDLLDSWELACWLGVLALQFWGLLMQFPQIHPHEFEVDWRLFASADWTLVLLSEFPVFGLLHQAQQAIQSCEMFAVGTTRLPGGHRLCPLPRCDLQDEDAAFAALGLEEIQRAQLFFDMLVNSALAGEAVFMVTLPGVPRCPLGQAAQELAFAVVDAVRYGAGAWPQISRMVMSAKSRMMKWLQGDLSQAPQRRDELGNISTADPLSEVLASRWNVLGLLHALQVVLRRSVDSHAHIPLPWLVAEGPQGLDLLADTRSLRGSFVPGLRSFLLRLRGWLLKDAGGCVSVCVYIYIYVCVCVCDNLA
ncbi:unnamed protein product [Symbiodinium sp. KB8]|nr:unnamed protein product [Symbiodinium sp. KB8]